MRRGIASVMDRQITFQRAAVTEDAFGGVTLVWSDLRGPIPAAREDVSDTERVQAGVFRERSLIRFVIRSNVNTQDITASDRVHHEGQVWAIVGIKEPQRGQRRQLLEVTCEGPLPVEQSVESSESGIGSMSVGSTFVVAE